MEKSNFTRRGFVVASAVTAGLMASGVHAATAKQAETLVSKLVAEINAVIGSGRSEAKMIAEFENIFNRYADVPTIARYAMGRDSRSASNAQMSKFTKVFAAYLSRKYGKQFRKFIGGQIEVNGSKPVNQYFEISTTARLQGETPFEVLFLVSDKSGQLLFFNMYIEGINMLLSERTEIGAILDKNRGDIDAMITDLARAG